MTFITTIWDPPPLQAQLKYSSHWAPKLLPVTPSCFPHKRLHWPFPLALPYKQPYFLHTSGKTHSLTSAPKRSDSLLFVYTYVLKYLTPQHYTATNGNDNSIWNWKSDTHLLNLCQREGNKQEKQWRKNAWDCLQTAGTHWLDDVLDGITDERVQGAE